MAKRDRDAEDVRRLQDATGDDARRAVALDIVQRSRNPEVLNAALAALAEAPDPAMRPTLHAAWTRITEGSGRRDSGGFVRAGIVRALHPIVQMADLPILREALRTYQVQGMYDLCGDLRVAALRALHDLDPDTAALYAARFLTDPRTAFSGEPAVTSVRVLAAQQKLEAVFALASWGTGDSQVVGEALRSLVELPADLVDLLVEAHKSTDDEQVLLGLLDLLLGHAERSRWHDAIVASLITARDIGIYGMIVTTIVASRDEHLIGALRAMQRDEHEPARRRALETALELA